MKVGALIPTMGDRQSISFTFKRAVEMGVEWIVCINKKSPTVDLWNKYLDGLNVLFNINCDVVLLLEDDDYYPVQYLQEMIEQWEKNGRPSLLGLQQAMYYHIYANKYHIFNNQNHCAAFCTLVSKEAKLPPLNESPHFDVELWRINDGKMVSITHQPVGVKHGNGMVGGKFHNAERFKHFDEDMVMYHKLFDKEAINHFKEIYKL